MSATLNGSRLSCCPLPTLTMVTHLRLCRRVMWLSPWMSVATAGLSSGM